MDKLWAPWRMHYIKTLDRKKTGCIFCRIFREKRDKRNFVFLRTKYTYAVLNIYPYSNGHALVIPNRHVKDLRQLNDAQRADLLDVIDRTRARMDKVLKPAGYNIGINLGRLAGGGIPGHLHVHVVPRWRGDVNFMPVVANTKVISQSLKTLFDKLQHADKRRN